MIGPHVHMGPIKIIGSILRHLINDLLFSKVNLQQIPPEWCTSLSRYILITGAGAAFYFCQICSNLKTAGDTKPQASPELILASSSFQI